MAEVTALDVTKRYPGATSDAVRGIDFRIAHGELLVILGPSGCGKTSTLRMIAGLESISSGTISFDGKPVNAVPPARRNVAMAFENYGLYEHWTVFDNVAYPLRLRGMSDDETRRRVEAVAAQLKLEEALPVRPGDLSGGLRQRVGLARALVRDPSVFLLDEPMSHVDADMRNDLRAEIAGIHQQIGATMVIVTHDQLDALMMADRILVMNEGLIEQIDTPEAIYERPATAFVAGFIGEPPMNLIGATRDGGTLAVGGGPPLAVPGLSTASGGGGAEIQVGFRPHHTRLAEVGTADGGGGELVLDASVYMVEPLGDRTLITLRVRETLVKAAVPSVGAVRVDQRVQVVVRPEDLHVFGSDGRRLDLVEDRGVLPA